MGMSECDDHLLSGGQIMNVQWRDVLSSDWQSLDVHCMDVSCYRIISKIPLINIII